MVEPDEVKNIKTVYGKPKWSLVDFSALMPMIRALEFGARKYSPHNWLAGQNWSVYFEAAIRHVTSWYHGEDLDPESGVHHLGHAMACLMILSAYTIMNRGTDDRPQWPTNSSTPNK